MGFAVKRNRRENGIFFMRNEAKEKGSRVSKGGEVVYRVGQEQESVSRDRSGEGRNCSSGSTRKRGGQHYENGRVIRNAMEFANDQLKAIAYYPKEKHATEVELRAEVVKEL
ncbi:subtilisin-like protease SBT3.17 isoform X1 [Cucumis melo var. makuwa]|uniref:Subtilisin-like protease SBT3.17 isoform X1 n=1 Tax=Cucumis melo var. makuwa TaxID=1194695 RepID=A0A5A7UCE1_CUCMM|nr:subtilisin-like protease SBT3.17 isoform X1 [Cucumis melo var. makuwa]